MRKGICPDCKKEKDLTKHSKIGNHLPPYIYLCRSCHDGRHGTKQIRFSRTQRGNNKNTIGTDRRKNK